MMMKKKTARGFSLLEVLIAMAIVGMVLGSIFSLLAGSKRLAFKGVDDIERTVFLRSAINAAQLLEEPEYPELPERYSQNLEIQVYDEEIEIPERQTKPMQLALEPVQIYDSETEKILYTVRLVIRVNSE
jgi:prepilin-type N-terminal cleavage/methylation domain-containing protein